MLRDTHSTTALPQTTTDPKIVTAAPVVTAEVMRMRAMRRQGWTLKSLARQFGRSIKEIEHCLGPDL